MNSFPTIMIATTTDFFTFLCFSKDRIRHHGRLVAPAKALEPVDDHCFIVSNRLFTAAENKYYKCYWCKKVSDTS